MRTADESMGRELTCPKCKQRLTIPTVEIPVPEPEVMLVDEASQSAGVPSTGQFSEPASTSEIPTFDSGPTFPGTGPSTITGTSSRLKYKRRKKGGGWGVLVIVVIVAAAAIGGFKYLMDSSPRGMTGIATANAIAGDGISTMLTLPEGVATERLVGELGEDPISLRTETFNTSFGASDGALRVTVTPADGAQVFEVNLVSNPAVASFIDRYGDSLSKERQIELATDVNQMVVAVGSDPPDRDAAAGYRDTVGLTALHNTLGPHLIAEAGGVAHPVVSEPSPGILRWILPSGTTQFAIIPAPANPGGLPADLRYTVTMGQ